MQGELAVLIDDGMARVRTALETNDYVALFRQQVRDLALALVAPVCADNRINQGFSLRNIYWEGTLSGRRLQLPVLDPFHGLHCFLAGIERG